jgi:hypothetical protein
LSISLLVQITNSRLQSPRLGVVVAKVKEVVVTTKTDPDPVLNMQATTEQQASTPGPFDPINLRLSQSSVETAGGKKIL